MCISTRKIKRTVRHRRIRARVIGSAMRPRLAVFRSARYITAQLIDDETQRTLFSASDRDVTVLNVSRKKDLGAQSLAYTVGEVLAQRAREAGISAVVFDRGGFTYHGRVKALAEGARKGGLKF